MSNITKGQLFQWKFSLVDVNPGPSVGDAAEFIESLGFDPWSLQSLDLVSESCYGNEWVSEFVVTGPIELVSRLRKLHDAATNSSTAPPRPVEQETAYVSDSHGFHPRR
jgi:hypothetical protein